MNCTATPQPLPGWTHERLTAAIASAIPLPIDVLSIAADPWSSSYTATWLDADGAEYVSTLTCRFIRAGHTDRGHYETDADSSVPMAVHEAVEAFATERGQ